MTNYTVLKTFTASRGRQLSQNLTIEQRYHGGQKFTYKIVETGEVLTSDTYHNLGFQEVK
jgi:hypothetical protein